MSILGTLIDKTLNTRAGDAGTTTQNVGFQTMAHSLPATFADSVIVNLRSVQSVGAAQAANPTPFGFGQNQSLTTIGYLFPAASIISAPTMLYEALSLVAHSIIR